MSTPVPWKMITVVRKRPQRSSLFYPKAVSCTIVQIAKYRNYGTGLFFSDSMHFGFIRRGERGHIYSVLLVIELPEW